MRDRQADSPQLSLGPAVAGEPFPGDAAVAGSVDGAARPDERCEVAQPRMDARLPRGREDDARVGGIGREVDDAGRIVDGERAPPALAAVAGAEHAAFRVRSEQVPERRDQHDIRIARVDEDLADVARALEADVTPALAAVARAVDAVAGGDVVARVRLAGADVEDARIRRRNRERADGTGRLSVEDRRERVPRVDALPHAAAGGAEVERLGLVGNAGRRRRPAAAERPDEPPRERRSGVRWRRLGRRARERDQR